MTIRSLPLVVIALMITSTWSQGQSDSVVQIPQGAVATQNVTSSTDNIFDATTITQDDTKIEAPPVLDSMSPPSIMAETLPPTMSAVIPIEILPEAFADIKKHSKNLAIIRGISAWLSIIASCLLIWMIFRSKERLSISYHRIMLGLGVCDVVLSIIFAHFNLFVPKDLDYMVWNARGNLATSITVGTIGFLAVVTGHGYTVSLNLYYLAIIKFNKKENYIRSNLEKWFHGIPIVVGFMFTVMVVVANNINTHASGHSPWPVYDPIPHCSGFEIGDVREGFKIPCGRGKGSWGIYAFDSIYYICTIGVPILILVTLGMMYAFVKSQEMRMGRYGEGALDIESPKTSTCSNKISSRSTSGITSSITSKMTSRFTSSMRTGASTSRKLHSKSRILFDRAVMYSMSYIITWIWIFIANIFRFLNVLPPLVFMYFWAVFNPLQGVFNLVIYIQPKVLEAKRQGANTSWYVAIAKVFRPKSSASKASGRSRGKMQKTNRSISWKLGVSRTKPKNDAPSPSPSEKEDFTLKAVLSGSSHKDGSKEEKVTDTSSEAKKVTDDSSMPLEKSNKLWLEAIETNEESTFNRTIN